jgi:hypothetical protein
VKQPSDFRQGVEAAAKWLREEDPSNYEAGAPFGSLADDMLAAVGDDPEGTEARLEIRLSLLRLLKCWLMISLTTTGSGHD